MYNLSVCCPQEKETWTGYHKNKDNKKCYLRL